MNNACSLEIEDRGSTKISYVISCAVSQPCPFNSPCQLNKTVPAWFYINENEGYNQPFSGNELVWGVAWADNQWRGANLGDWHYQTVDGTQFAGNPPQLFWFIRPSQDPSRIGGQLYSCIYATGYNNNKCKFEA